MSAIIELAQRLGKSIADSPQAAALRAARKELDSRPEIKKLLEDFQAQSEKLADLEQAKKPIEVADKHRLAELQDKLVGEEVFKKFTAAQVEYVDLMRRVNETLRKHMHAAES